MGTSIELNIARVSLDYAKNSMGNDYGFLFQDGDEACRHADGINYDWYKEMGKEDELPAVEAAFVRPLKRVIPRLYMIGSSLDAARAEYEAVIAAENEYYDDREETERPEFLSFDEFCSLACKYPLTSLNDTYIEYGTADRAQIAQGRFSKHIEDFERLPRNEWGGDYWSESSFVSAQLCILSPLSMLQVFSLNPDNADAEVTWQFGPLVNAGWVTRESFQPGADRNRKILVATEGASDARILRRALDLLQPDVADFFRFIDVDERHHFWGTGNLVRFAEGLLRIDIQNQVLFLLDNDAEGVDADRKLSELQLPRNMRSMALPSLQEFKNFPARGPEGVSACDINGRAAAIECYLDLNLPGYPPAQVLWSNYKKEVDAWHGALEHKESYMRHFLDQTKQTIQESNYDTSKLAKLLEALIAEAPKF